MNKGIRLDLTSEKILEEKIKISLSSGINKFLISNNSKLTKLLYKEKVMLIAPNVSKYVRDMTKYGMVSMGIKKLKSLGLINLIKLAFPILFNIKKILKKDFRKLLPLLVLIDYYEMKKLNPKIIFLHYQMTDLALANNNKELIESFLKLNLNLGLMTKNLTQLDAKLKEWNLTVKNILAPFNDNGYNMRSSKEECEKLINSKVNYFGFECNDNYNNNQLKGVFS